METLQQSRGELAVQADHLIRYVQGRAPERSGVTIKTTISSELQQRVQEILDTRLRALAEMNVTNGAVLVVDNRTAEVLAWVNGVASLDGDGSQIDAITTLRQPGSSLKPFLYAAALEKGWSPSTVITDAPLAEGVGAGLHSYRNYSRIHYGELPLREALGNSLNIPAIKTIQYVGNREFLSFLRHAGFSSLDKGPEFYGEGLALGNGEVSLLELVQGYVMLANRGRWRPLRVVFDEGATPEGERQIVSPEVSSLIGNILADPNARRREFGSGGLLRFPVQTAVKTGTSTDYRDAWVVGYTDRYTVGVWMGNLNRLSMRDVTGAKGPALVLRTVFADLQRLSESRPLYLAPTLARRTVCPHSGKLAGERCPHVEELFVPGTEPSVRCDHNHGIERGERPHRGALGPPLRISMPTPGLHIARDPRIPDHLEAVPFEVESSAGVSEITWIVDGKEVARTGSGITKWSWSPVEGRHTVRAVASIAGSSDTVTSHEVGFWVR
jgi:penicillin-binding protein 1C